MYAVTVKLTMQQWLKKAEMQSVTISGYSGKEGKGNKPVTYD